MSLIVPSEKYQKQLEWLKKNKQIKSFKIQPRYILQEEFPKNGKLFEKIEYIADFEITKLDGSIEIIDIRNKFTKEFDLKRKLFEFKYLGSIKVLKFENGQFMEVV